MLFPRNQLLQQESSIPFPPKRLFPSQVKTKLVSQADPSTDTTEAEGDLSKPASPEKGGLGSPKTPNKQIQWELTSTLISLASMPENHRPWRAGGIPQSPTGTQPQHCT